jgi:hypothetical protein
VRLALICGALVPISWKVSGIVSARVDVSNASVPIAANLSPGGSFLTVVPASTYADFIILKSAPQCAAQPAKRFGSVDLCHPVR